MSSPFGAQRFQVFMFFGALATAVIFLVADRNRHRHDASSPARAEIIRSSRDQELQKFSLTGYDDKGQKFWHLEGDTAKIDSGQTVFLDQNVTLRLKDQTVVRTDHVQWSQDGGTLRTDAPVTVDHENVKIHGTGAFGRPADNFVQLNRDIDMLVNGNTRVTCLGPMKIFYNDNKMIFYRRVRAVDERGVLTAKRMDVLFDPNDKKVNQIIAIGDVVIERGQDTTRSRRAVYSLATGSVRLEGDPEITLHKESKALLDGTPGNQSA